MEPAGNERTPPRVDEVASRVDDERVQFDRELVARIANGDERALGVAYDRHAAVLYAASVRMLADPLAAEEVVQDTFLALWSHAGSFDGAQGSLAAWLFAIARNRTLDHLRRASRRPRTEPTTAREDETDDLLETRLASGMPVGDGSTATDPAETVSRRWAAAVVRAVLQTMPPLERAPLELAYDAGLTQQEVAVRLGWPVGTVKTRTRRGLLRLRELLEGSGALDDLLEVQRGAR